MEPMTLGSNPSSPSSPGTNPNFLPSFLMGEQQISTPTLTTSPGRLRNPSGSGNFRLSNQPDSKNLRQRLFNQSITGDSPITAQHSPIVMEKTGPPKVGLFDTIDNKKKSNFPLSSTVINSHNDTSMIHHHEPFSRTLDESLNVSRNITGFDDSLNRNGNLSNTSSAIGQFEKIDTNWVTVFGFLPSTLSLVLVELSKCGPIIEKRMPPSGNWIHVKFNNPTEVSRALALNGKCINDCVMIGVSLYRGNKKEGKENEHVSFASPIHARSLRQSFVSPHSNSNSVIVPQSMPQKSTGLVTKAMEYVFGW